MARRRECQTDTMADNEMAITADDLPAEIGTAAKTRAAVAAVNAPGSPHTALAHPGTPGQQSRARRRRR